MSEIADHPPRVPLALRQFAVPRLRRDRRGIVGAGRRARLALPDLHVGRVAVNHRHKLLDAGVHRVGIERVVVVDDPVEEPRLALRAEDLHVGLGKTHVGRTQHQSGDPRVRNVPLDDLGRTNVVVGEDFGRVALGIARFVPGGPVLHAVPAMAGQGVDPAIPRGQPRVAGRQSVAQRGPAAARIDRIPVGRLEKHVQALSAKVVDLTVEPREVVDALNLLGLGPARLQADAFDSQRFDIGLELLEVPVIAVQHFTADGQIGAADFLGAAGPDRSDPLQARRQGRLHPVVGIVDNWPRRVSAGKHPSRSQ